MYPTISSMSNFQMYWITADCDFYKTTVYTVFIYEGQGYLTILYSWRRCEGEKREATINNHRPHKNFF